MPVQPDPTHPKFLEGDDVLKPPTEADDVEGHLAAAVPGEEGPRDLAAAVPDDLAAAVPEGGEDRGPEDLASS